MITYGYTVKEHDDSYVDLVETAARQFSSFLEPQAFLVDVVPARKSHSLRQPSLKVLNLFSFRGQCNTYQAGFLERGGKSKASTSPIRWTRWRIYLIDL